MREGTVRVEVEREQGDMSAQLVKYPMHLSLWRAAENGQRFQRIGKAHRKLKNKKLQGGNKKLLQKKKKKGIIL